MIRPQPLEPEEEIPAGAWPDVPDHIQDIARVLAERIRVDRAQSDIRASVKSEEALYETVIQIVEAATHQPGELGLNAGVAHRLAREEGFRVDVIKGTMVLASWLYPLSRLVYLLDGLEEIHIYRWDHWIVTGQGLKVMLGEVGNPFGGDDRVLSFFKEKVLSLPGAQGHKQLSEGHPIAETNVGGLMRVAVFQSPAVSGDTSVLGTIRLQGAAGVTSLDDYVNQGVMPRGVADFLTACIVGKASLVIGGGTASGKTTMLRVLCGMIPHDEQLLVIEDSAELHLELDRGDGRRWHPHVQHVCTVLPAADQDRGVNMRDLVRAALRLRPTRIILGEARDASMSDVCMAASTGHDGSMVTLHCDDAFQGVRRAAEYVMMAPDFAGSANAEDLALRRVHQAFDVVVHLQETSGGRRRVTGVVAIGPEVGNLRWIYGDPGGKRLVRETRLLGDLPPRLRAKISSQIRGPELPDV